MAKQAENLTLSHESKQSLQIKTQPGYFFFNEASIIMIKQKSTNVA